MNKIILASASAQRKKLLAMLGLEFRVIPSQAPEQKKITTTCAALVQANALAKAREVAGRLDKGIVIGADSVVYLGGKQMIGKPRDLKEAKKNLKLLFARPHWVYTGVAVIDAATGKQQVDYEKTKIFMTALSDAEVDRYHRIIPPLDKAGGFDIEGWGSVFIRRIEGCYTNVIGLPMAKLFVILKKFGVTVLGVLLVCGLSACSSEFNLATGKQETLMYDTDKDVNIGDSVDQQILRQYKVVADVDVNERVKGILKRITAVCDRKDFVYFIRILEEKDINAVSLPGGYVYVFSGLIDKVKNDDQLAGVIAHEVGHITARHGVKRQQAAYQALLLQILATRTNGSTAAGVGLALESLFIAYSQEDELEADRLAVKYTKLAGYKPEEINGFFRILKAEQAKEPSRQFSYWRTHPYIAKRIAAVNQAIHGKMEFRDYLNLTEPQ
ncbi:MAG: septum formation protein Maf [Candidatus Omnitrophica bacterium]|nr:septum formation protein Maf [Candidatus Omnitrophota bacterium]